MFLFLFLFNFFLSLSTSKDVVNVGDKQIANEIFKDELPLRMLEEEETVCNYAKGIGEDTSPFDCSEPNICTHLDRLNCTDSATHTDCKCKPEYASIKGCNVKCEYERKKQLTAFLLELFVGFGAGHFYRGSYLIASLKLVAFIFGIYIICLFPLTAKCISECCDCDCLVVLVSLLFFACSVGLAFWFVFDLVRFGKNLLTDKYDIKLKQW
jgi:uncharacterized membrane protein (Fun14 family)